MRVLLGTAVNSAGFRIGWQSAYATASAGSRASRIGCVELFKGSRFATGGYTCPGTKYKPAGMVQKGEFVMDSEPTKRRGVRTLNRLNNGGSTRAGIWPKWSE